jgi:tetratricopeptide (TPR) repeat protein
MTNKPEIFFSYAWGDTQEQDESREKIVLDLHISLKNDGYNVAIDKEDLGYTGYISKFMEAIGQGKAIVVVVSQKYARSPYCMFELYEIARNCKFNKEEFRQKVLPIMVEFVDFADPLVQEEYLAHWDAEFKKWSTLVKKRATDLAIEQMQRFDKVKMVKQNFSKLTEWLIDMNSLSKQFLAANDFAIIKQSLTEKLAAGKTAATAEGQIGLLPKHLTPPPFISEVFLGREDELETVHKKLFESDKLLLLVNGDGGMGKTTLAARYYHKYAGSYQYLAWVLSEKNIANALLLLAVPLGLQFGETMDTKERLELLLTKMAALQKPWLLVIDNANEPDDLEANYMTLRRCSNFHLLLTTRITGFEKAATYKIEALPYHKALELFKEHYTGHDAAEDYLFEKVYEEVGGNTLVIELLAKNLYVVNTYRRHYSLSELVSDLQKGLLAISKTKQVSTHYHSNALLKGEPLDIMAAMYDISELSPPETRLLSNLAILPAENIPFAMLESLLPATPQLEETLLSLSLKGWIEHNQFDAAFKISPVVQEITRKKNEDLLEDCGELIDALIHGMDYEGGNLTRESYEKAPVCARFGEALASCFSIADNNLAGLYERMGSYNAITGNLPKALQLYQNYHKMSQQLCNDYTDNVDFKNGLAISYEKLGQTHAEMGDLPKALSFYELRSVLGKQLFDDYPDNVDFKKGLAISYSKLGETHAAMGNLPKALIFYEDYFKLSKQLFDDYSDNAGFKNGLAISYEKLGQTHAEMGNLPKALSFYEKRSALGKQLFDDYPDNVGFKNGLAISYSKLGQTHADMGNVPRALSFYEDLTILSKQLFDDYPDNVGFKKGLAISYQCLGNINADTGNLPKALNFYEDLSHLAKQLFDSYPDNVDFKNGLAISYEKLGETHATMGNLPKALSFYELRFTLSKQLFDDYPDNVRFKNGLAISYSKLGETHATMGNLPKALSFYELDANLSKQLFDDYPDNVGFKNGMAISYEKLGETHGSLGNLSKALSYYEDETVLFKELFEAYPDNVGFKNGMAISYEKLGTTYEASGDTAKRNDYYQQAKILWEQLANDFPEYVEFKKNLDWLNGKLA